MADVRRFRPRLARRQLILCVLCATSGLECVLGDEEPEGTEHPGVSRLLDETCAQPSGCVVTGSARITTGITVDAVAIRMGPAAGSVALMVPEKPLPYQDNSFRIEALVRGNGTFQSDTPSGNHPLWETFEWIDLGPPGFVGQGSYPVTLSVAEGSTMDVADLRFVTSEQTGSCAVGRAVGSR